MKVLLYFEQEKNLAKSGIGRALRHQIAALTSAGIEYTLNPNDDFDIAHINTLFPHSYKVLKKCHKQGKKVIVHGHSTVEDFRNSFRCWKLVRHVFYHYMFKMYRNADCIITPTPYSKKLIEGYKGITCPVYAISNGISLEEYAYNEEYVKKFKQDFDIQNQKVVIGAGLYFPRKGIYDFIEVAKRMPEVKFIWFGYLHHLLCQRKMVKAIKQLPKNLIMPGYHEIKGAYMASDCFFFPSYEETEGIVILESLATKIPTVTRRIGVYDGWLIDNETTLMADDVDGFVKKIKYVLNNDMSQMCEKGVKIVEQRSIDKIGLELKKVYELVLGNKK